MSRVENAVEVLSERAYFSSDAVESYSRYDLMRAEALTLLKYQPFFANKDILDIGIGAGRTTVYLAPLAKRYVGIDFSPTLVDHVKKSMPQVQAQLGDMRDLSEFKTAEFDFVMGSYNVLDCVVHDDRIKTLSEVHRVMKPNGVFVFSSHNRAYESAGSGPKMEFANDPVRLMKNGVRWLRRLRNHSKWKKFRVTGVDYVILNDVAHDFSTLHYYIDQDSQRRQLEKQGFCVLEVFDIFGNTLAPQAIDSISPFLMYVARKSTSQGSDNELRTER